MNDDGKSLVTGGANKQVTGGAGPSRTGGQTS